MQPVNWGILSTSSFATERFLPGLRKSPMVRLAAVGSRDLERAKSFARTNGVAKAYGSYEEVLEDPEVEIVYVPRQRCVESKSLKLYLASFRNEGAFCEALAVRIRDDVAAALELPPERVSVALQQKARGGITIVAST